jgi:hypothetical protein
MAKIKIFPVTGLAACLFWLKKFSETLVNFYAKIFSGNQSCRCQTKNWHFRDLSLDVVNDHMSQIFIPVCEIEAHFHQHGEASIWQTGINISEIWPFTTLTLVMETVKISEMLVFSSTLTRLTAWEDFGTFIHLESFKSYIISKRLTDYKSQDSAVSIATGYGLDNQGVRVRVLVEARIFSSPCCTDRLWSPPSLLSNGYQGFFPRW